MASWYPRGKGANPVTVWEPVRHLQSERVLWRSAAALLGVGKGGALESNPWPSWGRRLSAPWQLHRPGGAAQAARASLTAS